MLLLVGSTLVTTFAGQVIARSPSETTRSARCGGRSLRPRPARRRSSTSGSSSSSMDDALDGVGLGSPLPLLQIVLPIGISFFTFQAISYVVDVHRRETRAASLGDVAILQALLPPSRGGADRARQRAPPAAPHAPRPARSCWPGRACSWSAGGLIKKTVVADELARRIVDPVFNDPAAHSGLETAAGDLRLRGPDLLRLLRLHRHGHRARAAARLRPAAELRPPVPRHAACRSSGAAGT